MNKNDYENILYERYEDGFAAGREEGREEVRMEIVRKLYANGMSVAEISELTSLSEESVKAACRD